MEKIIIICEFCGRRVLVHEPSQVSKEEKSLMMKDAGVEQDGKLFWDVENNKIVPKQPSPTAPNAFTDHELLHKVQSVTDVTVKYTTSGPNKVILDGPEVEFEFDGNTVTLADALSDAMLYLA